MDSSDCLTGWILYGLTAPARYGTDTDPATHHGLISYHTLSPKISWVIPKCAQRVFF